MVGLSTKGNIQWEVTTFNSKKKFFSGINGSSSLKVSPISKVLKFAFRGRGQNIFSREWWGTRWRWGSAITDSKETHCWWGKTKFIQSEGVSLQPQANSQNKELTAQEHRQVSTHLPTTQWDACSNKPRRGPEERLTPVCSGRQSRTVIFLLGGEGSVRVGVPVDRKACEKRHVAETPGPN